MKKTQKDLVNEFTNLHLQILAIAEEINSEEMIRCAIATSEAFFNKLEVNCYDNPYQNEVWEAENDKRNL
jgi:alcohol dehydrogenase YqhD (iron-dependent ADH family)